MTGRDKEISSTTPAVGTGNPHVRDVAPPHIVDDGEAAKRGLHNNGSLAEINEGPEVDRIGVSGEEE